MYQVALFLKNYIFVINDSWWVIFCSHQTPYTIWQFVTYQTNGYLVCSYLNIERGWRGDNPSSASESDSSTPSVKIIEGEHSRSCPPSTHDPPHFWPVITYETASAATHISYVICLPWQFQLEAWQDNNQFDPPLIPTKIRPLKFGTEMTNLLYFEHR